MAAVRYRCVAMAAGVAAVLTLLPAPLAATWSRVAYSWNCSTGSFQSCTSVEVATVWDGSSTHVMIRMRNGGLGLSDGVARSINGFQILSPAIAAATATSPWTPYDLSQTTQGAVVGGGVPFGASDAIPQEIWLADVFNFGLGIVGCDLTGWEGVATTSTCAPGSWVVFNFRTDFYWTVADAQVNLLTSHYGYYGYYESKLTCSPGMTCEVTIPEPITVVLLTTGLVGIGALRQRRRKKDELA